MITLYNVIEDIRAFCSGHTNINGFDVGDITHYTSNDYQYPLVWLSPIPNNLTNGQFTYNLNLSVMDTVLEHQDKNKVLSDTLILVGELITYFDDSNENIRYYINKTTSFTPFYDRQDNTTGWTGDIQVRTPFAFDQNKVRLNVS